MSLNAKAKNPRPLPYEVKIPKRLLPLENKYGVDGIKAVLDFGGSMFQAIKKSLEDGTINPLDAIYLIDPLTKLAAAIKALPTIPNEVEDTLTDEELHEIMAILLSYGVVPEDLREAFEDHLTWIRDTKRIVFKYYIKK